MVDIKRKRKRKQKQPLKEFKAWLQGVEELQPDDWCPNVEQWQLIRDKINGIVEENKTTEQQIITMQQQPKVYQQNKSLLAPPPPVGGVPGGAVDMTLAAQQMLNPTGNTAKTPDIDTSNGNVTSSFA